MIMLARTSMCAPRLGDHTAQEIAAAQHGHDPSGATHDSIGGEAAIRHARDTATTRASVRTIGTKRASIIVLPPWRS